MSDADESKTFVLALSDFAANLAGEDVAIYGIAYDFMHFGSWTLEIGNQHKRQLVQWDGKESSLAISAARVSDSQSPKEWKLMEESKAPDSSSDDRIFGYALDRILATADA